MAIEARGGMQEGRHRVDDLITRSLWRQGPEITTVGLGAWAMGGGGWSYGWGPQDDATSIRAIHHAVELGVNWIDTAAIYGLGHSEEVIGKALNELPSDRRPLVFTKGGEIGDPERPYEEPVDTLAPASIRREVDASLRRLGVERIDLYQFHQPDQTGVLIEESWAELVRLADEGKVGAIGVANFDVSLLERAEAIRHVDSLQIQFSVMRRGAGVELIPWAKAHGTGVIVYQPMESGMLTDSFSAERVSRMAADDWRRSRDRFQEPALSRNLALRDALRPVAKRHGTSVAAVAVAWTISWPGVTGAIVGARSPEQVDGWIAAGALRLNAEDLDEIASAVESTGVGSGPVRPPTEVR
ncbi:MAG: aldo/keto reductase [Fimbriimonadales bacterium]